MASPTIQTLTSFSGADLVATFANKVIGELQQISWAVQRDKAPVFTCGSPDARSFSRGKRGLAGSMVFAVFDHDALVTALQTVWNDIAPAAMFTAAGNNKKAYSEDFSRALDILKWNTVTSYAQNGADNSGTMSGAEVDAMNDDLKIVSGDNRAGYGFSYGSDAAGDYTNRIDAQIAVGSNGSPIDSDNDGFVDSWNENDATHVYVPAGFSPIRGENVIYADTLPPFDVTLTFASEYGHTAFQKIYDVDILNESSGVSTDTVVMQRQITWIARRLSPLIRGVYSRDDSGNIRGLLPTDAEKTV